MIASSSERIGSSSSDLKASLVSLVEDVKKALDEYYKEADVLAKSQNTAIDRSASCEAP